MTVSLGQQISELLTLRREHDQILSRDIYRGRRGDRERAFRLERLDAAIATLQWLQAHADRVRAAVGPQP